MKISLRFTAFFVILLLLFACCSSALALPTEDQVVDSQGLGALLESSLSWQDKLGLILTNPVIATILLVLGIVGLVLEIATVGSFGAFGAIGGISFLLYFLGAFWYGSFSSVAVWLLLIGMILLALEIFVIPGFGVCGGLGVFAILGSLIFVAPNPMAAIWSLLIALIVSVVVIYFSLKNRKTSVLWGKLILSQKLDGESGFDSVDTSLIRFQGCRGRSLTVLRPSGSALIEGERLDVLTQGEYVEADRVVEVVLVEGMRIVVREIPEAPRN